LPRTLKSINVPTPVMHGDDDQIVPIADSAPLSAKLLKNSTLKIYEMFPHGMCTTRADVINPDLMRTDAYDPGQAHLGGCAKTPGSAESGGVAL